MRKGEGRRGRLAPKLIVIGVVCIAIFVWVWRNHGGTTTASNDTSIGVAGGVTQDNSTRVSSSSASTPQSSVAASGRATQPVVDTIATGILENSRRGNPIAPLRIETDTGSNYFVKLVNISDSADQITIYVRGGDTFSTKVPFGTYEVRVASGDAWQGRDRLFGSGTSFSKLQSREGSGGDQFQFKQEGNQISGMTLILKKSVGGNMPQREINRNQF